MHILAMLLLTLLTCLPAVDPWPGRPVAQAVDLGPASLGLDPAGNFFEMSDAHWNPRTRTLWTVDARSGSSVIYGLAANPAGTAFTVVWRTSVGPDVEGITQALDNDVLYLLYERTATIQARRISTGALIRSWDLGITLDPFFSGKSGPEGLTFIPDASLAAGGFTRGDQGTAYPASAGGLGGIFLVAHQNGGHLYAFDLAASASTYAYLGRFRTGAGESSGLAFDRSINRLFISHNTGSNPIEITTLASTGAPGARTLDQVRLINGPQGGNVEGIAVTPALKDDGSPGEGWFFAVTDNNRAIGGAYQARSIVWYDGMGATLAISAGDGQQAQAGSVVPVRPQVRVQDVWGDALTGLKVTFAIRQGGGTIAEAIARVGSDGVATAGAWRLGMTAGVNTLIANAPGLAPVTFTATGMAGPATSLTIQTGDRQQAMMGTSVAVPPAVMVKDANGNPLSGAVVAFTVVAGGGAVTGGASTSGKDGIARTGAWRLGGPGINRVRASAAGLVCDIQATAIDPSAGILTIDTVTITGRCPDTPDLVLTATIAGVPATLTRLGTGWTATAPLATPLRATIPGALSGMPAVELGLRVDARVQAGPRYGAP